MSHYWMVCGLATPQIVRCEGDMVYHIGKATPTKRNTCIGCTFERIPDHHPVSIDYPAILQHQAV